MTQTQRHAPAEFNAPGLLMAVHVCVCQELQSNGEFGNVHVVIAGLSNVYTHYITTFEEYQVTPESHSSGQMCWQLSCGSH